MVGLSAAPPRLDDLLSDIHACRRCSRVVPGIRRRTLVPRWDTDLMLMAQAPSESGVRLSGVHWLNERGELRAPGGTYLDRYLRRVGYSIDPREEALPRPYTTNVVQCWPGAERKRDRRPTAHELANCSIWWQAEIELLRPRAVLLLGRPAADAFLSATPSRQRFDVMLERQGALVSTSGLTVPVFAVPHPTAPYRGMLGGRNKYYEHAFKALGEHLRQSRSSAQRP